MGFIESAANFNNAAESADGGLAVQAGLSGTDLPHPKKLIRPTTTIAKNNFLITGAILMQKFNLVLIPAY